MENKTLKERLIGNEKIYDMGVFLQCLLLPVLIIIGICSIFISELLLITEFVTALMLFVMAYNNYKFFNRKGLTITYIIVGILVIVISMVNI